MQQLNFFEDMLSGGRTGVSAGASPVHKAPVFELSDEQKMVVVAPLRQRIKIRAFAGAGKTTVLEHKAHHHASAEGMRGLYLAYNKSAQLEAQPRFGRSAMCKTTHGLAFVTVGRKYAHKLRQMKPKEVVDLGFTADYAEARAILDAVSDFCINADMKFPDSIYLGRLNNRVSNARAIELRNTAEKLWQQMCDANSLVPMSHDGYLKLYQLSRPRLPGDYVMIDEFQDTNPVVLDIITQQTQPVIVVGDPYQSIYAFRGAVNAMQDFRCQFNFALTQSRRFGPEVAAVANDLLDGCFGEKTRIVGSGAATTVHGGGRPAPEQLSIVTRTNAELFEHAVHAYEAGMPTAFVGGVAGYEFERFCDLQRLAEAKVYEIKDPFIRSFSGLTEIADYAESVDDYALKRMLQTRENFGADIYSLVAGVHAKATTEQASARRVLTTAHKSKGSTLDHVLLGEDFKPLIEHGPDGPGWVEDLDPQEVNLSYVSCTRARLSLQLCSAIKDYRAFYKAGGHLAGNEAPPY
jgi:hypothetical protein